MVRILPKFMNESTRMAGMQSCSFIAKFKLIFLFSKTFTAFICEQGNRESFIRTLETGDL